MLQVKRIPRFPAYGRQKIPMQPIKLPVTLSCLEFGVHCLAIGLLGQFSFFENIMMNLELCIDIVHELFGRLTENLIA
jgi:hypothetical protein